MQEAAKGEEEESSHSYTFCTEAEAEDDGSRNEVIIHKKNREGDPDGMKGDRAHLACCWINIASPPAGTKQAQNFAMIYKKDFVRHALFSC